MYTRIVGFYTYFKLTMEFSYYLCNTSNSKIKNEIHYMEIIHF